MALWERVFIAITNRGGVVVQGTELVIPYFVFRSRNFRISTNSSYVENYGCFGRVAKAQFMIILTF